MEVAETNQAELSLPDVEALVAEAIDPSLGQKAEASLPADGPKAEAKESNPFLEIEWKGQTKKLDTKQAKTYAQKGFDYEQNTSLLKKERADLQARIEKLNRFGSENELEELFTLNQFSKQNPWVTEMVKAEMLKRQGQSPDVQAEASTPRDPLVNQLLEKVTSLEQSAQAVELEKANQELDQDLAELKSSFDFISWDKANDLGYTPEHEVLKLIADKGITAKQAFWMLYGEQAADTKAKAAARSREEALQEKFKRTRTIGDFFGTKAPTKAGPDLSQSFDQMTATLIRDLNLN